MGDSLTNPEFDYSQIDADIKSAMLAAEGQINQFRKRHVADVIKFGEVLQGIHEKLANYHDGVFGAWLDSLGISTSSAYRAMKAHLAFSGFANLANLELSAVYELADNTKAKKKAIKLADKGVLITYTMAKTLIAETEPSKKSEDEGEGGGEGPPKKKRRKKPPRKLDAGAYYREWHKALGPLVRLVDRIARDVGTPDAKWKQTVHDHLQSATDDIEKGLGVKPKR